MVVLEVRNYIVADTVGSWYWHGTKGASVLRAVKHAFCSHFGTLAFAGLVMWFVEYLKKKAKYKGCNPYLCILKCIAMVILSCKLSALFLHRISLLFIAYHNQFYDIGQITSLKVHVYQCTQSRRRRQA